MIRITILATFLLVACGEVKQAFTSEDFTSLMTNVSEGWSTQDTDRALSSFHEDAIYMEPPSVQYFRGHSQLRPYFDALDKDHRMTFHNLWFDEEKQTGVGEFTFSYGSDTATVGIVVVELENGKIKFWREYLQVGPTDFERFLSTNNKDWEWHIGNYP